MFDVPTSTTYLIAIWTEKLIAAIAVAQRDKSKRVSLSSDLTSRIRWWLDIRIPCYDFPMKQDHSERMVGVEEWLCRMHQVAPKDLLEWIEWTAPHWDHPDAYRASGLAKGEGAVIFYSWYSLLWCTYIDYALYISLCVAQCTYLWVAIFLVMTTVESVLCVIPNTLWWHVFLRHYQLTYFGSFWSVHMMQTVDSLHVFARAPLFPNIYTQQF